MDIELLKMMLLESKEECSIYSSHDNTVSVAKFNLGLDKAIFIIEQLEASEVDDNYLKYLKEKKNK